MIACLVILGGCSAEEPEPIYQKFTAEEICLGGELVTRIKETGTPLAYHYSDECQGEK